MSSSQQPPPGAWQPAAPTSSSGGRGGGGGGRAGGGRGPPGTAAGPAGVGAGGTGMMPPQPAGGTAIPVMYQQTAFQPPPQMQHPGMAYNPATAAAAAGMMPMGYGPQGGMAYNPYTMNSNNPYAGAAGLAAGGGHQWTPNYYVGGRGGGGGGGGRGPGRGGGRGGGGGRGYFHPSGTAFYPAPPGRVGATSTTAATAPQAAVAPAAVVVPPSRPRKALVITDKKGNPIDLTGAAVGAKKKTAEVKAPSVTAPASTPVATAAVTTATATTTAPAEKTAPSSMDAGAKLRQAAMDAIQGKTANRKTTYSSAGPTATDKKETEAAAQKKMVEEEEAAAAAALKKRQQEEEATAAAQTKKEQQEKAAEKEKEAAPAAKPLEPATATTTTPKASSLASLLSRMSVSDNNSNNNNEKTLSKGAATVAAPAKETSTANTTDRAPLAHTTTPANTVTQNGSKKRFVYSKAELMRLKELPSCLERPAELSEYTIEQGPSMSRGGMEGGGGGGGGGGRDGGRRGSQARRGGGGSDDWQRGQAAPPRRASQPSVGGAAGAGGGGGGKENDAPWARGQAPPPRPADDGRGGGGRGGRGGGRGGRGGRDGRDNEPFFDGPVAPLSKSANGWRPRKNTSTKVVAEKKVKAILNKMTKEKFDRLSGEMCEIPITSHEILTMIIANVYQKAIDEPSFGDMYGDLCVKLSQKQTDSFVKIIESDEEYTDDGEATAAPGESGSTSYTVYRWSNDVSTTDEQIVGPFSSEEECLDMALSSETQQEPVERGEMELELYKLQIKNGVFIKIMKKKGQARNDEPEEGEEAETPVFYTVFFPVQDHEECGQQLSKIFLSERECMSDANKQNSFKRILLNKCEDEFLKQDIYEELKKEKAAYNDSKSTMTDAEQAEKEEEMEFRRIKIKKQMLGNIQFIGQLYKKNLLKEKIMRFCIADLLQLTTKDNKTYYDTGEKDGNIEEEDHEAICSMFATIGLTIDRPQSADFMKVCFDKIKKLSAEKSLPSRSRFMYKDLLDLRSNKWVPRRKVEKAKTIEEIRKDFEREERLKEQQSAAMHQGGGGRGGGGYGRNDYGGRGGGGGGGRGDYRGGDARQTYRDSGRPRQAKPQVQTDDDGFTTIVGGSKAARSSLSQAASVSGRGPPAPSRVLKNDDSGASPSKQGGKATPEPLDEDKFDRRVKTIRSEYMQDPGNMDELLLSFDELTGTPDYGKMFVSKNADRIIDSKDDERKAIYSLVTALIEKKRLERQDVEDGLVDLIEFIDSFVFDAPRAFEYLADILAAVMKVGATDVRYVCEQAEKTKPSDPSNPQKIIQALVNAVKADGGAEAVKTVFGPHQNELKKLLGDTKWEEIKATVK